MPELLSNGKVQNVFTSGGSSILSSFGRTKSAEQIKKDAQRVNSYSDVARSTDSIKTQRISKAAI